MLPAHTDQHLPSAATEDEQAASSIVRRAPHYRSRNGCLRCKQRHVRCDETKPSCLKCVRLNVQCPGYASPAPRLFGLSIDEYFASDFEKMCFNSFLQQGTRDLMASQPTAGHFWQTFVPQLSQVHSAVRHATIAISVMQEPLTRSEVKGALQQSSQDVRTVAIRHFNQSIREFLQSNSSLRVEAKLTCCLLYTILTAYLERSVGNAMHVNAADFVLKEHEKSVARGEQLYDPTIDLQLAPVVHRQIVDASAYVDGFRDRFNYCGNPYALFQHLLLRVRNMSLAVDAATVMPLTGVPVNSDFSAVNECSLVFLNYSIGYYLRDYDQPELLTRLRAALAEFKALVDHLYVRQFPRPVDSERYENSIRSIYRHRIHYQAAIVFANCQQGDEMQFDKFKEVFAEIVSSCELLASIDSTSVWCTSLGQISPLFLVATKCRDHDLRHRSLKLLHDCLRVENAWSSCVATTLAKCIIAQEENMLNSTNEMNLATTNRLRIQSVSTSQIRNEMILNCEMQLAGRPSQIVHFTLQYDQMSLFDGSSELCTITDRVIQAAGYGGPVFSTPRIVCHCRDRPR